MLVTVHVVCLITYMLYQRNPWFDLALVWSVRPSFPAFYQERLIKEALWLKLSSWTHKGVVKSAQSLWAKYME